MASVADTVIVPMQDVLGLGSEARMNLPGTCQRQLALALSRPATLTDEMRATADARSAEIYER